MTMNTNPKPPKQALRVKTLGAMLDLDIPEREYLLLPWLRQGDSALIYAPTGAGKSIFTLALCLAVAGGGDFLGWRCAKPRKVFYVDGEMPEADIIERARMLLPTIEGCDAEAARGNLCFLARQAQHMDAEFPDLATPEGQADVLKRATAGGYELLVLDNFSTLAECEDENAAGAFNGIVKFLMRAKQAGLACVLIHHSNKNGTDYRGSSKLATTFEVLIGLSRSTKASIPRDALGFDLAWAKYRHKRDATTRGRSVWFGKDDTTGALAWHYETTEAEELGELVELVKTLNYAKQAELAEAIGISTGELSKRKARAIVLKLISEEDWAGCLAQARSLREGVPEEEDAVTEF